MDVIKKYDEELYHQISVKNTLGEGIETSMCPIM
jgi:hypothetical protein